MGRTAQTLSFGAWVLLQHWFRVCFSFTSRRRVDGISYFLHLIQIWYQRFFVSYYECQFLKMREVDSKVKWKETIVKAPWKSINCSAVAKASKKGLRKHQAGPSRTKQDQAGSKKWNDRPVLNCFKNLCAKAWPICHLAFATSCALVRASGRMQRNGVGTWSMLKS